LWFGVIYFKVGLLFTKFKDIIPLFQGVWRATSKIALRKSMLCVFTHVADRETNLFSFVGLPLYRNNI